MSTANKVQTDRRRLTGPEGSVLPIPSPQTYPSPTTLLNLESYLRTDSRYPEQLRPVKLQTGIISRAAGSTYVEIGKTKLVCSVYGPRGTSGTLKSLAPRTYQTLGTITCNVDFAPFSSPLTRRSYQPEIEEQDLSNLLLQSIEPAIRRDLFPNSFIDIYVTIFEDDGSILTGAIIGSSLALSQARIDLIDSIVSCSAIITDGSLILVDPTFAETKLATTQLNNTGLLTIAWFPNRNELSQCHLVGNLENPLFLKEAVNILMEACRAIYQQSISPLLKNC